MQVLSTIILLALSVVLRAQSGYNVGDKINNFSLNNSADGNKVNLTDYSKYKAVVVAFTSHTCPYSKLYEDRLLQLSKDFEGKEIKFIFINPNSSKENPEEASAAMAKRAQDKGYSMPYLVDDNQEVCSQFNATKTPEIFVLKPINGSLVLQYKGAIDDNPQMADNVKSNYLKDVLNSILSNSSMRVSERRASGCVIKKG